MVAERTWRMRLIQPYALGRASVAGRVSDGARQSVGMLFLCVNVGMWEFVDFIIHNSITF